MKPLEQQGLVLRQLAALRGRGVSAQDALGLVEAGIEGELAARIQRARAALAAGEPPEGDGLDRLPGGGAEPDALEEGAQAVEARLAAATHLATFRFYAWAAVVLGLVFLATGALLDVPTMDMGGPTDGSIAMPVQSLGRFALAIGGGVLGAAALLARRRSPGVAEMEAGAHILEAAAAGLDPRPSVPPGVAWSLYEVREVAVGPSEAAELVAGELVRFGNERAVFYRHALPIVGAALLAVGAVALTALLLTISATSLQWLVGL